MKEIKVLDCTLRDGGYINNWDFGDACIRNVVSKLVNSEIDIIECGYLNNHQPQKKGSTLFFSVAQANEYLPQQYKNRRFVAMVDYGEFDIDSLPICTDIGISGIRVCFHKKDMHKAMDYCKQVKERGYSVFVQPMATIIYSDEELLDMLSMVNELMPYACYFVDSFGVMNRSDMLRLFYLINNNLSENIVLGYHAHNNIQMAYANAQTLMDLHCKRKLIVDSSVYGMGRGAGNLNTELLVNYLNENFDKSYLVYPLLEIIDEELNKIYAKHYWGYSLPQYLSSVNGCHPNYATYLSEKNTLSIHTISEILSLIDDTNKTQYSQSYIEKLYQKHQSKDIDDAADQDTLRKRLFGHDVLVIASGNSINTEQQAILNFIKERNPIVISVNFVPEFCKADISFFSNQKRYEKWKETSDNSENAQQIILTSNLYTNQKIGNVMLVNYNKLVVNNDNVRDNATLLLLNLLCCVNCKMVNIAGFDGYIAGANNYYKSEMNYSSQKTSLLRQNENIEIELQKIMQNLQIQFITATNYKLQ